jgi:S-adenosylmethionine synthetase
MPGIQVTTLSGPPLAEQAVEVVERKGVGHPDSICDAVMEEVSVALSQEYLRRFGAVLHHNIDKGFLVAGRVERRYGGGRVVDPMRLIFGDRATFEAAGERIPVDEIAVETAKAWFRRRLSRVDPDRDLCYQVEIRPGSAELTDLFLRGKGMLGANDTSAAVGYAPLTATERTVLDLEQHLNSPAFKAAFPETGEDVKIMGYRQRRTLLLTAAMPLLDRYVASEADYFRRKAAVVERLEAYLRERGEDWTAVRLSLNTLDLEGRGMGGIYLSVLGTSAEDADSGQVGRGNRVNGVITLNRPMGTEAAAGKNPVSHVGKIYTFLTHKAAQRIYAGTPGIREVYVWLGSQIGEPIDQPRMAAIQFLLEPGADRREAEARAGAILEDELGRIGDFCMELAKGTYPVC